MTSPAETLPGAAAASAAVPGLRERKREQSRHALERAAVAAALESGYEQVSVEQIAERAGVSARTFFNYFGTKDAVFLDGALPRPSEDDLRELAESRADDPFAELIALFARLRSRAPMDPELSRQRKELFRRSPSLVQGMHARIQSTELALVEVLAPRIRRRREAAGDPVDAELVIGETTILVQLTTTLLRYATAQILLHGRSEADLLELMREGRRLAAGFAAE